MMDTGLTKRDAWSRYCAILVAAVGVPLVASTGGAQAQSGNVPLDTVTVENQQAQNQLRTEGKDTYTSNVTSVGSKSILDVRQIPQSVSIVTRQRLDDQNLTQLEEAMRHTVGMLILQNDVGRSSIFSRGYEVDVLVNGLYAPNSSILGTQPDLFMFDRIEVLKGPGGLFNGATAGNNAGPGATVNLVRKQALDRFQFLANVGYGSYNNLRTELDLTGPLNAAKTVRARVVGAFQNRENFVDFNENKVFVGYGTIDFDFTENTTLSLSAWRQERDVLPFNGLPWFAPAGSPAYPTGAPRNTFIGATWNRFDNRSEDYMAELTHKLQNGGHWKTAVRYTDRFIEYKYAQGGAVNPVTGDFNMSLTAGRWFERHLTADSHISTPFSWFGQTHNFTIGVDYKQHDLTQLNASPAVFAGNPENWYTFNPAAVAEPPTTWTGAGSNTQDPTQYGVYSQLRLKPVEPITLIFGGRFAWYNATVRNAFTGAVTSDIEVNAKFVPYAGIVVDLTRNISAYASYTNVFSPQTEIETATGQLIGPRTGDQFEAGLKGSFLNGTLNASIAAFVTQDTNRALAVQPGPTYLRADVELQGIEVEVSGKITPQWEVYGGYTMITNEYVRGAAGDFRQYQPRHSFNFWNKYTFTEGPLQNFHIGGGIRGMSEFYSGAGNGRVWEDGYVVADLQIGYKFNQNVNATFTVTNLFDEVYYARVGSTALFNFYGEPRAFQFKLNTRW